VQHAAEDDLELYAMRSLPAPESERLEEHLLVCVGCQDRLTATDQYVAAMRFGGGEDQGERNMRIGALEGASGGGMPFGSTRRVRIELVASYEPGRGVWRRHLLFTPVRLSADFSGDCRQSHPKR
jgi:hypothetical protein